MDWGRFKAAGTILVFHDVMVSTFKFGGNRRFFGVDTADFVGCRGSTRAIRFPVVSDIPVSDVTLSSQAHGMQFSGGEEFPLGFAESSCAPIHDLG